MGGSSFFVPFHFHFILFYFDYCDDDYHYFIPFCLFLTFFLPIVSNLLFVLRRGDFCRWGNCGYAVALMDGWMMGMEGRVSEEYYFFVLLCVCWFSPFGPLVQGRSSVFLASYLYFFFPFSVLVVVCRKKGFGEGEAGKERYGVMIRIPDDDGVGSMHRWDRIRKGIY